MRWESIHQRRLTRIDKRLREVERSLGLSLHTKVDTVKHKRSSNGVTERR
jgi:hypothetical protein